MLLNLAPSKLHFLVSVVEGILGEEDVLAEYQNSAANSTWVLGACLEQLSRPLPKGVKVEIPVHTWARVAIEKWHWSATVLGGLVSLIDAR